MINGSKAHGGGANTLRWLTAACNAANHDNMVITVLREVQTFQSRLLAQVMRASFLSTPAYVIDKEKVRASWPLTAIFLHSVLLSMTSA